LPLSFTEEGPFADPNERLPQAPEVAPQRRSAERHGAGRWNASALQGREVSGLGKS
jgi:hypothetical protein